MSTCTQQKNMTFCHSEVYEYQNYQFPLSNKLNRPSLVQQYIVLRKSQIQ